MIGQTSTRTLEQRAGMLRCEEHNCTRLLSRPAENFLKQNKNKEFLCEAEDKDTILEFLQSLHVGNKIS